LSSFISRAESLAEIISNNVGMALVPITLTASSAISAVDWFHDQFPAR
jgi:hypothetical protein